MRARIVPLQSIPPHPLGERSQVPGVAVVIPCLNESMTMVEAVGNAREAFASRPGGIEVIMADNGSTVGSAELAHTAGARVVLAAERGYGAALQTGLAAAQAADIVSADADLTYGLPGGATATYNPP